MIDIRNMRAILIQYLNGELRSFVPTRWEMVMMMMMMMGGKLEASSIILRGCGRKP